VGEGDELVLSGRDEESGSHGSSGIMNKARSERSLRVLAGVLCVPAAAGVLWMLYLILLRAPDGQLSGITQLIQYFYLPSSLTAYLAFGVAALGSLGFLLLRDDRFDAVAVSGAELGVVFSMAALIQGVVAAGFFQGDWWVWDVSTTLMLLLLMVHIGYFILRSSTEPRDRGRRFAAVLGVVAAADFPLIYQGVRWFHAGNPEAVMLWPESSVADPVIQQTLSVGVGAFSLVFVVLLLHRYGMERVRTRMEGLREGTAVASSASAFTSAEGAFR
jgi:heme exporter protein C